LNKFGRNQYSVNHLVVNLILYSHCHHRMTPSQIFTVVGGGRGRSASGSGAGNDSANYGGGVSSSGSRFTALSRYPCRDD
jgi:hypothetical protein